MLCPSEKKKRSQAKRGIELLSRKISTIKPLAYLRVSPWYLSSWLRNQFVIVTKSAICAGANLYGRLKYFSGKSRDNCPIAKEDLTLGEKKEVFLLPQDDSLWNNINGSSRDMSLISRAAILTANLLNAEQSTQAFYNDSKDMASLQIYSADFPCRATQVFQRQKGRTLSFQSRELQIPPGI